MKLGEICSVVMGQSPESQFYNEDRIGLPFHQGVTDFGRRYPKDRVYCTVLNRLAERGDILCSVRAPVGRLNIANKRIVIGRGLCAIRSKANCQGFIYQQLKRLFEEDIIGGGTIFKAVTKSEIHDIKMVLPHKGLVQHFEGLIVPVFGLLKSLTNKNDILARTHDFLLPKLISGEMDLSELEIVGAS